VRRVNGKCSQITIRGTSSLSLSLSLSLPPSLSLSTTSNTNSNFSNQTHSSHSLLNLVFFASNSVDLVLLVFVKALTSSQREAPIGRAFRKRKRSLNLGISLRRNKRVAYLMESVKCNAMWHYKFSSLIASYQSGEYLKYLSLY
jgi:hypothetical protein